MAYSARLLSTDLLQKLILQAAHGFTLGQVVRFDGANYVLAQADTAPHAEIVGMVTSISDANHFWITQVGYVSGLVTGPYVAGSLYYLSPTVPGTLTTVKPITVGQIVVPCFIADTTTSGYFFASIGEAVGVDNIGANTALSNLTATAINLSLISDSDITDDLGTPGLRWNNIYGASLRTGTANGNTLTLSARDVDGAAYVPFVTLTAGNTPTGVLNGDITTTTQAPGNNTTKIATTAFVQAAVIAGNTGANVNLSNLVAPVAVNQEFLPSADLAHSLGDPQVRWDDLYAVNIRTGDLDGDIMNFAARDVDGGSYHTFIVMTAGNTPTCMFSTDVTAVTQAPNDNSQRIATTEYVDQALGGFTWSTQSTAAGVILDPSNGYIANNVGAPVPYSLPAVASIGDTYKIVGRALRDGWTLAQQAGQYIQVENAITTVGVGGSIASTADTEIVEIVCVETDTVFVCTSIIGNLDYF